MAIVKAMIETDNYPDFIVIDGAEGGTGAAPVEFMDNVGMPMVEGFCLFTILWSVQAFVTRSDLASVARLSQGLILHG